VVIKIGCRKIFLARNIDEYRSGINMLPTHPGECVNDKEKFEKRMLKKYLINCYKPQPPVSLHKCESPDFILQDADGKAGLEISRIVNEKHRMQERLASEYFKGKDHIVRPLHPPDGRNWKPEDFQEIERVNEEYGHALNWQNPGGFPTLGHPHPTNKEIDAYIGCVEKIVRSKLKTVVQYKHSCPMKVIFYLEGANIGHEFEDAYCTYSKYGKRRFISGICSFTQKLIDAKIPRIIYILVGSSYDILVVDKREDFIMRNGIRIASSDY